ncbi:hypothetical protein LIX60_17505 [Streptomyces sp. S07_1.15]|uniref:hypothetical protein n=1 Tax=Streptomyces sp. S07_1.15 TaxID=2873925 RepID=UPI001D14EB56|nr:hypothetical protein [Streptomyces sp. S07_1.15]MCC3653226.1 hypothetical protein [Streptomyces sp. S07_1.15]
MGLRKKTYNIDDLPADKATWESRISHRAEVLNEAREDGDQTWVARAEQRLDSALDGYNRDAR